MGSPAPTTLLAFVSTVATDSTPSIPRPAGEGLRRVAHGFSALGLTDHQILEREFIYDARYAECLRRVRVQLKESQ
jgi:hypothetical protein